MISMQSCPTADADKNLDSQEVVPVFQRRPNPGSEFYVKLDKRVRLTIRQLGYPTKNSLKGWFRKYEQRLDLQAGYAGREPKFSPTQKAVAIFESNHRCYGYRRLQASLSRQDMTISKKVVQRLMKKESLVVAKPKQRQNAPFLWRDQPSTGEHHQP